LHYENRISHVIVNQKKIEASFFSETERGALSYLSDIRKYLNNKEGGKILKCFLKVINPIVADAKVLEPSEWYQADEKEGYVYSIQYKKEYVIEEAKRKGNDGVIFLNAWDNVPIGKIVTTFKSTQIKLADGTNTTFDSNNPDIRYKNGGHLESSLDIKNVLKYLNPTSEEKEISIRRQWDDLINRFSSLIPYFFEQENIDYNCEDYECIDFLYENNLDSNFEKWIIDNFDNFNFEDFDIPSWYYFEKPKLIKGTFIHYSNNVDEILKNGFTKGVNDISILGMTTHLGDEYKKGSGFIFAYHIDDVKNIKLNRYGENCVLFEGIGVRAYHKIDKEYEVIINPKDIVNIRPCIRYKNGGLTMKKLLAPNGQPSNLTPEQYRLVRTPEFKAWFGDWENSPETSSKVVDENNEPLVVYHGSNKKFYVFDASREGVNKKTIRRSGSGIYFTNKERVARMFTDNYGKGYVYPCFLLFKNPIFLDAEGGEISYLNQLLKKIPNTKDVIVKNTIDVLGMYKGQYQKDYISDIYITANPKNIKLADKLFNPIWTDRGMSKLKTIGKTNTTFDGNNPDIRYAEGGTVDNGEANYGKPPIPYDEIPLIHEASSQNAKKILKYGFNKSTNKYITNGVYTIPLPFKTEKFDSRDSEKELVVWLKKGSKIFWTNSDRPTEYYLGDGNIFYKRLYNDLNKGYKTPKDDFTDKDSQADFSRRMESWLKNSGYVGVQQGGEVVITDFNAIESIEIFNREQYELGGELTLTSEQVENKLGRKLHWWNDDVVIINGTEYKKVFLKPEYKIK
jgi:hypothetical protein